MERELQNPQDRPATPSQLGHLGPPAPPPPDVVIGKTAWEGLAECYRRAVSDSESLEVYYRRKAKSYERYAVWARRLTFVFAASAAFCSTVGGAFGADDLSWRVGVLQACVGSATLAGILVYAEQVFGWSSAWARNILAASELAGLQTTFVAEWCRQTLSKSVDQLDPASVAALHLLVTTFERDVAMVRSKRTQEWEQKFGAGNDALAKFAQERRDTERARLDGNRQERSALVEGGPRS